MNFERVLITGGRDWTNRELIRRAMIACGPGVTFAHGAAHGADNIAAEEGRSLPVLVLPYPVLSIDGPWPGAGPNRNTRMLINFKPTLCLAFPDPNSRGTYDMVRKCKAAGVPVIEFNPKLAVFPAAVTR